MFPIPEDWYEPGPGHPCHLTIRHCDDLLIENPHWAPQRPVVGIAPKLSDAELLTLAVIGALLRIDSEARFIRYASASAYLVSLSAGQVGL